jgi:hypothetical protein
MFRASGASVEGLVHGNEVAEWMRGETARANEFVLTHAGAHADGGLFEAGLLGVFDRADALLAFTEFFSPAMGVERDRA